MGALDPATGCLRFRDRDIEISPLLTRTQFLASETGKRARVHIKNEPWCSWSFLAEEAGEKFGVVVYFNEERLKGVDLDAASPRFGLTWEEYTADRLDAQMKFHKWRLSESCGIGESVLPWGSLDASFNEKGGFAGIWIRYGEPGTALMYGSMEEQNAAAALVRRKAHADCDEARTLTRRALIVMSAVLVVVFGLIVIGLLRSVSRAS